VQPGAPHGGQEESDRDGKTRIGQQRRYAVFSDGSGHTQEPDLVDTNRISSRTEEPGRTPLGGRDISLVDMSDDMTLLLKELCYGQVDAAPARGGTDSSMLTGGNPAQPSDRATMIRALRVPGPGERTAPNATTRR
jgi:hypothetical protein